MQDLIALVNSLTPKEGYNQSFLEEVGLYRASRPAPREPFFYLQRAFFCVQGTKVIYWNNREYTYDMSTYMVAAVPLPLERAIVLEEGKPLLSLTIDLSIPALMKIIQKLGRTPEIHSSSKENPGLYTTSLTTEITDILRRLLKVLQSEEQSRILGEGIYQELLYSLLQTEHAAALIGLTVKNSKLWKIETALREIHDHYQRAHQIDDLARMVSMSPSSFHQVFKEVTAASPLQYIKKIRLDKARSFLEEGGLRVNEAAGEVGYESVSQFSREFKRYYGVAPKDVRKVAV
jgi:AraC-like DNA-binding protein